jgi:hypothetical protein
MFVVVDFLFSLMIFDTVQMIKKFPYEDLFCESLCFNGDVGYIECNTCIIQWNVITDAIAILDGYPGLILHLIFPSLVSDRFLKVMFMVLTLHLTGVLLLVVVGPL